MPVARGPQIGARGAVIVGGTGVGVALMLIIAIVMLARSTDSVEVRLGDRDFRDLDAVRISAEIAEQGPVLFGDVAGGSRDIILQHIGADPLTGWLAFEARRAGQARHCYFQWRAGAGHFVSSCDPDDVVDADGRGLVRFPVTVVDGDVRVDINAGAG